MRVSLQTKLIVLTPIFFLFSHYLAVFPHEYGHSTMAWLYGYKSNPFAIDYGGNSWLNILLLAHIDENVNYNLIFSQGHNFQAALIAFAGPGLANGLLYILSLFLINHKPNRFRPYYMYFLLWFNFMNLANFYDYVPIRTFGTHGDIAHISQGLNLSPWWIYAIGSYLVGFLIWQFFTKTLPQVFTYLKFNTTYARATLTVLFVCLLFGLFAIPGSMGYGEISHFLSVTSLLAIPAIILMVWPTAVRLKKQSLFRSW